MKAASAINGVRRRSRGGAILTSPRWVDLYLLAGLFFLSLEFVQIGGARISQLWALLALIFFLIKKSVRLQGREVLAFGQFIGVALLLTGFSGYDHVKPLEQIIKFVVIYPTFYLLGRSFGRHYLSHRLPFGYLALFGFLLYQLAVQKLNVPVIYQTVEFMQDSLHGSFKEHNWFATFFFCTSFVLFLQSGKKTSDIGKFLALGAAVALLSESKTVLIPCGIVLMTQTRGRIYLKIIAIAAGSALYYYKFSQQLSGDMLSVKLEQERGLALIVSIGLVAKDWLGYGFGFVESYFATSAITVIGLGAGTNSIFCSPLDFMLIAGVPGVLFWLVFFCGLGLGWRTMLCLSPLAAWSLINPMHQSEMVYLFCGYLVSWGHEAMPALAVRKRLPTVRAPMHVEHHYRLNRRAM
ncbi:hypothetical protein PQQ52_15565 [Paraburkholderia sediminicola]|uniref:hypothetical protein n=1 Tax=Paraburkholderia sediminicola TaxID=458836 RepID=UPI0038BB27D1